MSRRRIASLSAALVAVLGAAGTGSAEAPGVAPDRAKELRNLVEQDCGSCHGLTRRGGLGAPLTHDALAGHSAHSIAEVILDGVPGTAMPPWRPLMSEADAMWIANFLLEEHGR